MILNARRKLGAFDFEALEPATRTALHRVGARLLEELLEATQDEGQPPLCPCGSPMRCEGPRPKRLVSLLGVVSLRRPYYHCRHCWRGAAPLDRELIQYLDDRRGPRQGPDPGVLCGESERVRLGTGCGH